MAEVRKPLYRLDTLLVGGAFRPMKPFPAEGCSVEAVRVTRSRILRDLTEQRFPPHPVLLNRALLAGIFAARERRGEGIGPSTASIMARCSRFSCVWKMASPARIRREGFDAGSGQCLFLVRIGR